MIKNDEFCRLTAELTAEFQSFVNDELPNDGKNLETDDEKNRNQDINNNLNGRGDEYVKVVECSEAKSASDACVEDYSSIREEEIVREETPDYIPLTVREKFHFLRIEEDQDLPNKNRTEKIEPKEKNEIKLLSDKVEAENISISSNYQKKIQEHTSNNNFTEHRNNFEIKIATESPEKTQIETSNPDSDFDSLNSIKKEETFKMNDSSITNDSEIFEDSQNEKKKTNYEEFIINSSSFQEESLKTPQPTARKDRSSAKPNINHISDKSNVIEKEVLSKVLVTEVSPTISTNGTQSETDDTITIYEEPSSNNIKPASILVKRVVTREVTPIPKSQIECYETIEVKKNEGKTFQSNLSSFSRPSVREERPVPRSKIDYDAAEARRNFIKTDLTYPDTVNYRRSFDQGNSKEAPTPPPRRRSVKDVIESINRNQQLLKLNQTAPVQSRCYEFQSQRSTNSTSNDLFKFQQQQAQSEKEINEILADLQNFNKENS